MSKESLDYLKKTAKPPTLYDGLSNKIS